MMYLHRWINLILFFTVFSLPLSNFAAQTNFLFNLPPRIFFGLTGGNATFAEADSMIPIWGNTNETFHSDFSAKYGDDQAWLASIGCGERKIFYNTILGAYIFGDYNKTPYANTFSVLNPGVEWMTNEWDTHLNGFIPLGQQNKIIDTFTEVQFSGHTQYNALFNWLESIGPGAEVEVGRIFPSLLRTRVFAGGYFFLPKRNFSRNINGITGGIETPLRYQWATLEICDSYDNIKRNTFALTLRITFGGLNKSTTPVIQDRMLDPIPRHLGNLQSGDGIPSRKNWVNTGKRIATLQNIWFFDPDGSSGTFQDGTFEHPFVGLSQTKINAIQSLAPNANFYLSSGTYLNPNIGSGFTFYNGQNISGRNKNFKLEATGNVRPLITDSLILNGNNSINNLRITANTYFNIGGSAKIGVLIPSTASAGTINLFNNDIATSNVNENGTDAVGVWLISPNTTLNISNSTVRVNSLNSINSIDTGVIGSNGNLNIINSFISVFYTNTNPDSSLITGVGTARATVNIIRSKIFVNGTNSSSTVGITNVSSIGRVINISQSKIVTIGNGSEVECILNAFSGVTNIDQSQLFLQANNNPNSVNAIIHNDDNGRVNVSNSLLIGISNMGRLIGIRNEGNSSIVNLQNNKIFLKNTGSAILAPTFNLGQLNNLGGNQCFVDGILVPC